MSKRLRPGGVERVLLPTTTSIQKTQQNYSQVCFSLSLSSAISLVKLMFLFGEMGGCFWQSLDVAGRSIVLGNEISSSQSLQTSEKTISKSPAFSSSSSSSWHFFSRRVWLALFGSKNVTRCGSQRRRVDQKGRNPKWWDDWGGGRVVLGLGFQFSVFRLRSCVLGFLLCCDCSPCQLQLYWISTPIKLLNILLPSYTYFASL